MKFKSMSLIVALACTLTADARERKYVSGDGGMDYKCQANVGENEVSNIFDFHLMYDANSDKSGFEMISDENLKSGNGDLVYMVSVTQSAEGLPENPSAIVVPGCKEAITIIEMKNDTLLETYFECSADGDSGYGKIIFDTTAFAITGEITFPEGQSQLPYPIKEGTTLQLTCD